MGKTSFFARTLQPGQTPETGKAPIGDWKEEPVEPAPKKAEESEPSLLDSWDDFKQGI